MMNPSPLLPNDAAPLAVVSTTAASAAWILVSGEIDVSNHHRLVTALSSVNLHDVTAVHMQISGLTFCDVRGVRHLLAFAQSAQETGHRALIHGASHQFRKMTRLLGTAGGVRFA